MLPFSDKRALLYGASLLLLAACSSTPYTPAVSQADPIDVTTYEQKADTFIVLLDASGGCDSPVVES